jgi:hypothetical protein
MSARSKFAFLVVLSFVSFPFGRVMLPQTQTATRAAVERALPMLQKSAATIRRDARLLFMPSQRALDSDTASGAGSRIPHRFENSQYRRRENVSGARNANAVDEAVQAINLSDPTPNESLLLMAAHASGMPHDTVTGVVAQRMATWQRDGHWVTSDFRPPHSSSLFTATATAVRAIRLYMPDELSKERDATIQRARQWLITSPPGVGRGCVLPADGSDMERRELL